LDSSGIKDTEIIFISGQPGQQIPTRTLHVLHNSEHPASTFALLEVPLGPNAQGNMNIPPGAQTGVKTVSLVADNLFDLLVAKMGHVYSSKKIKIESKGPRFELGDFVVKLGSVLMSQNFKGILVEVSNSMILRVSERDVCVLSTSSVFGESTKSMIDEAASCLSIT